jgi:hypothetical protein
MSVNHHYERGSISSLAQSSERRAMRLKRYWRMESHDLHAARRNESPSLSHTPSTTGLTDHVSIATRHTSDSNATPTCTPFRNSRDASRPCSPRTCITPGFHIPTFADLQGLPQTTQGYADKARCSIQRDDWGSQTAISSPSHEAFEL